MSVSHREPSTDRPQISSCMRWNRMRRWLMVPRSDSDGVVSVQSLWFSSLRSTSLLQTSVLFWCLSTQRAAVWKAESFCTASGNFWTPTRSLTSPTEDRWLGESRSTSPGPGWGSENLTEFILYLYHFHFQINLYTLCVFELFRCYYYNQNTFCCHFWFDFVWFGSFAIKINQKKNCLKKSSGQRISIIC